MCLTLVGFVAILSENMCFLFTHSLSFFIDIDLENFVVTSGPSAGGSGRASVSAPVTTMADYGFGDTADEVSYCRSMSESFLFLLSVLLVPVLFCELSCA